MKKHRKSFTDWTGKRVGRLTVIKEMPRPEGERQTLWHVRCDCGVEKFSVMSSSLKSNKTTSCGCYRKEVMSYMGVPERERSFRNKVYNAWNSMVNRCTSPVNRQFPNYGGRGIKVCQRWLESFDAFVDDMGVPAKDMSLDRIDVNGNYEPSNCRWATSIQQAQNKRASVYYEWNGEELCLMEICRRENVRYESVFGRVKKGVPVYESVRLTRGVPFKEKSKHLGSNNTPTKEQIMKCGKINNRPILSTEHQKILKAMQWCISNGIKYRGRPLPKEILDKMMQNELQPTP